MAFARRRINVVWAMRRDRITFETRSCGLTFSLEILLGRPVNKAKKRKGRGY